jgi:CheY-like chemotaxis protein
MAKVIVVDDDLGTRLLIAGVLKKAGHEVVLAEDGVQGLDAIRKHKPELVVSDVEMPNLDGFSMLAAVREEPAIGDTAIIMLTSLDDRAHLRMGMLSGADDFLGKPVDATELLDSVGVQLARVAKRIEEQGRLLKVAKDQLFSLYEKRVGREAGERWPVSGSALAGDVTLASASLLFMDIANFASFSERLTPDQALSITRNLYSNTGDTAHLFGARHLQFVGDGLLAVFADEAQPAGTGAAAEAPHGLRNVRAARGMISAVARCQAFITQTFTGINLPALQTCMALHCGSVVLTRLADPIFGGANQVTPVGDAVTAVMQVQKQALRQGWQMAVTEAMQDSVPGLLRTDSPWEFELRGRSKPLVASRVLGFERRD